MGSISDAMDIMDKLMKVAAKTANPKMLPKFRRQIEPQANQPTTNLDLNGQVAAKVLGPPRMKKLFQPYCAVLADEIRNRLSDMGASQARLRLRSLLTLT